MTDEAAFLAAMSDRPDDHLVRLAYADWLEEHGDPRGELIRLLHTLTQSVEVPNRDRLEDRLRSLVAVGVQPVGPFFTNSIGMKFAWIPAGTFLMGSPPEEQDRSIYENQHQVTLTRGFYIGIHPVTQSVWAEVMASEYSLFRGDNLPVERVQGFECEEFLRRLSARHDRPYRLPTESEWEYACRAGSTTPFHFGTSCDGKQANCNGNCPYGSGEPGPYLERTTPVGSYLPNAFGLYDMHGNVGEWCADSPGEEARTGRRRLMRGGSWRHRPEHCRAAVRWYAPEFRDERVGFRVAFHLD